jgi:hypothetical protein
MQNNGKLARSGDLCLAEPVARIPQAFSTDHFGTRVSSTPAASNK